jgi:hypothetical protein
MMRLTFILLVFFNLLVYAWTQGYFGASDDNHEPQRMAQQLHADKLRIISQSAAPAVKKEALACRVVNGLTSAEAAALKAAVGAGGGEAQILPMAEPNIYLVLIGELANAAAAEKRQRNWVVSESRNKPPWSSTVAGSKSFSAAFRPNRLRAKCCRDW